VASEMSSTPASETGDQKTDQPLQAPSGSAAAFRIQIIPIDNIVALEPLRRPLNAANVARLVRSIERDGLKTPIDVVPFSDRNILRGKYQVIAGAHRFAACERLGMEKIAARILEPKQAVGWEEAENIFRYLPALDESVAIVNYAQKHGLAEVASAKGSQPHDKGYSRVANAMGYDRNRVKEAYAHHALSETIKSRVRLLELDDNRRFLTQLSKIDTLAGQGKFLDSKQPPSTKSENTKGQGAESKADPAPAPKKEAMEALLACWEKSPVKKMYEKQSDEVRQDFRASLR
jgi:ParB-like chromosome segregation protein Spo0J